MKFFKTIDDLADHHLARKAFNEVLPYILDSKPENIVNPYYFSLGKKRNHRVSDLIDNLNVKIVDDIVDDIVELGEDISSECVKNNQLFFDF